MKVAQVAREAWALTGIIVEVARGRAAVVGALPARALLPHKGRRPEHVWDVQLHRALSGEATSATRPTQAQHLSCAGSSFKLQAINKSALSASGKHSGSMPVDMSTKHMSCMMGCSSQFYTVVLNFQASIFRSQGGHPHLLGFAGEAAGVWMGDTASSSRVGEDVREP